MAAGAKRQLFLALHWLLGILLSDCLFTVNAPLALLLSESDTAGLLYRTGVCPRKEAQVGCHQELQTRE